LRKTRLEAFFANVVLRMAHRFCKQRTDLVNFSPQIWQNDVDEIEWQIYHPAM